MVLISLVLQVTMVTGDISNDEVLLTCVPDDALGDEQVDEDLPRRTGDKEPGFQNIFGLASCLKHIRLVSD